jgi:hypothetical protein
LSLFEVVREMLYSPERLDVESTEKALRAWEEDFPRPLVDLAGLRYLDPFGALLLVLEGRRAQEAGGYLRVLLPRAQERRDLLARSGIVGLVADASRADGPWPRTTGTKTLIEVVEVGEEEGVGRLVGGLMERLLERFPLGESGTRLLAGALLELFQNIPQHASLQKDKVVPFGLGALQEFDDHLHLVVADKGVGLRRSLSTNPRFRGLDDSQALEAVLVEGASRFDRPGRGGALRRIRELLLRNAGKLFVRSGAGALWQADVEWVANAVHPFPGVQVSIRLPRRLFE